MAAIGLVQTDSSLDLAKDSKTRAQRIISRFQSMESSALNFRTRWQDSSNYIQPRKGNILTKMTPGQPQTILLWDTTAEQALLVYAAGLISYLTPTGERWFRYEPRSKNAVAALREWLDQASEIAAMEIAGSNFYEVFHEDMLDGGCFGSSLMRTDEHTEDDGESILNFVNIPVGTFYWDEDNRGRIGTIGRKWKWNVNQAVEEFGEDKVRALPQMKKALESRDNKDATREFHFIEMVRKRAKGDWSPGIQLDPTRRQWESVYVAVEDQDIIHEDGYYENPYAGCRVMRANNEVYGRGPGTQAMPEIKMVNRMEEDLCTVIEKLARPSWIAPDDTAFDPDNRPDGVTFWDASKGEDYKPHQIEMKNRVDLGEQKTEQKRKVIRDYFFNDMFKLFTSQEEEQREKTAYEVQQMQAERLILFSPIFGRITIEKLNPILYRVFSILYRNNRLPPLPAGIDPREVEFDVAYVSKIALAIKAVENQSLATAIQIIQTGVAIDPSLVNLLKLEVAVRQVFHNTGVPSAWIRSEAEYAMLVKQQQDQQARLQAAQAAEAGSQTIKNLGPQAQSTASKGLAQATQAKAA